MSRFFTHKDRCVVNIAHNKQKRSASKIGGKAVDRVFKQGLTMGFKHIFRLGIAGFKEARTHSRHWDYNH
ncbi:Uncharacterised protein [Vibrio cholerae]|nr:Uncharacterised protein [Vibrio cholerae]